MKNQTHYGIELKYSRDDLIKSLLSDNFQEGLWIDATYLNDVDYLNLGSRDYRDLNSLVTSKINYFLADENNFTELMQDIISTHLNLATIQPYKNIQAFNIIDF